MTAVATNKIHLDKLANRIESLMARAVVQALLDAGYRIAVDNGEDERTEPTNDYCKILTFMAQCDDEVLYVFRDKTHIAWVKLIYGNGEDCISDFSMSLDPIVSKITAEAVYEKACHAYDFAV